MLQKPISHDRVFIYSTLFDVYIVYLLYSVTGMKVCPNLKH